jgi:hypothetical protein
MTKQYDQALQNLIFKFGLLPLIIAAVFCCLTVERLSAQGPENTMVVINAESSDSLAVANHYIHLRDIPATNVVYVSDIKTNKNDGESIGSKGYKQKILGPVMKAMKERGLKDQIDCVTFSAGLPTRVQIQPEQKKYLTLTGQKYSIQRHTPWASISSLTYFYANAFSNRPSFLDLDANRYAPLRFKSVLENPFTGRAAKEFDEAQESLKNRDYADAEQKFLKLAQDNPLQLAVIYSLARAFALNGNSVRAIQALTYMRERGFSNRSIIAKDRAFSTLKDNQEFNDVVNEIEDLPANLLPTRSFSSKSYWSENAWANGSSDQGENYLLSTVLAFTGKGGSTVPQALNQLSLSVGADGTKPEGLVYFAQHGDPRSKTRHAQFSNAFAELKSLNREVEIGKGKLPTKDSQIVGATLGSPKLKWNISGGAQFVPGALCDNFTSYGGWWAKKGQTQLTEFLNNGAAGSCGTVCEPYTIFPKIPSARLHAHYFRGSTLAEAFYQSVSGPFQLLIVGDPMCCPFGVFPEFTVSGLEESATVTGDLELSFEALPDSPKIWRYEVFFDGLFLSKVSNPKKFRVATDALNDGYHELRVVAVADTPSANRRSQKIGFQLNRSNESVELSIQKTDVKVGEKLSFEVRSTNDSEIEVFQNSRIVATSRSGMRGFIDSSKLGIGKSKLHAVVRKTDDTLQRSLPVEISIAN